MTMRFIKRRAFRLKVWKTLNAVVGVVTILNVSLVGTLLVATPSASADGGSIWTTKGDCGGSQQDVNHFDVGEHVFINGSGFEDNHTYSWQIKGQPSSEDPNQVVASGSRETDDHGKFCFDAYTVQWNDGGEYKTTFGDKHDNYRVDQSNLKVSKKLDSDGNGSFETTNPTSFQWGFNGAEPDRTMGQGVDVAEGKYTVTESSVTGYRLVGWYKGRGSCSDTDGTSPSVNVTVGDHDQTITFCNARQTGDFTVYKFDEQQQPQADVTFTVASDEIGTRSGTTNGSGVLVFHDLPTGPYTVTETSPTDYHFLNVIGDCTPNDNPTGVTVTTEGQSCTFTNARNTAPLTVLKRIGENGNVSGWTWNLDKGDQGYDMGTTPQIVTTGNHSVTEIQKNEYKNIGWTCYDSESERELGSDTGETLTVNVPENGATCVFTNEQKTYSIHGFKWSDWDGNGKWGEEGTLSGWKIFIDQNGNGTWDDGEPSTLTNSDGYSFDGLTAGQYRICEVGQTGWQQTYPIDSELNNCHLVNLPDENSEAQYNFGNEQLGSVTIHKQFDDNGDGAVDRTDPQTGWSWDVTNGPQDNLAGATVYLDKGPTTVTEDPMTGFTSTWFCSNQYENSVRGVTFDGYQAATVDQNGTSIPLYVWPGQNLDCTFVNTRDMGTVTVLKNVDTDGNGTVDVTGATDWTWDVTGGEQNIATGSSRALGTGSITVSEDQKANFHVTGLACTVNREPITVPLGTSATFDLAKGANVVCTFTNTRDTGTLTVNKSYDDNSDSMVDRTNPAGWTWDIVNGSQDNAGGTSKTLATGSYTINEDAVADYNSAWSCTNQTSGTGTGLTVALTNGQNIVCTFTNTKRLTVLGLQKSADPTTVNPTKTVTYTMKWGVAGNTQATNVVLTDPIPANVTFVSADNGGSNVAGAVTWNLGTKAPGTNGEVHWTGTVAADVANGTVIPNTAMIDSAETDPVFSQAATITVVVPQVLGLATNPALTITKTVDQKTAEPNDIVTYSITVKNTGDGDAMNVTATDTLPLDLSFVEGTGRTRTWDLGTIPPGGAQTVTVDVRVERDAKRGDYVNTATATATDVGPVQAEATLTVKTPKVLGLATTGVSGLDRLIALAGLALVSFGLFGLRRPKLLRPKA